jgi:serine/threonine protein kinase/Tol biopolymer transport system component
MTLATGTRLGPYEVLSPIGKGGMGEVYRARDTRLERDVAIKVLPQHLSSSAEVRQRFEREAKTISQLSHPHICALYDVGNQDGVEFLVMEYLEGESLAARLMKGALSLDQTLRFGVEIADALDKAHRQGVVHRDLKPGNVMLTKSGTKLLDFGLAKTITPSIPQSGVTALSTAVASPNLTEQGTILGTVQYMAPEQLEGKEADSRTDIFALGDVLYEMATGREAFAGTSNASLIGAILKEEPPSVSSLQPMAPPALDHVVKKCLAKDPDERWQSAADVASELRWIAEGSSAASVGRRRREVALWAALILVSSAALAVWLRFSGLRSAAQTTFRQMSFRPQTIFKAAFAPDGETVIYSAALEGNVPELFVIRPEFPEPRPLGLPPRTHLLSISSKGELAVLTNARYVAHHLFTGTLARVSLGGTAPREILEDVRQADWSPDGSELAIIRAVEGKDRLEFPIGKVLYETAGYLSDLRVSPRGDRIAFFKHPAQWNDLGSVIILDRAGKRALLSSTDNGGETGLSWSQTGDEVLFSASADENDYALYGIDLSGHRRNVLRSAGALRLHDVSRTGRWLVTHDEFRREIAGLGPGASAERDLSWLDGSGAPFLSRDGRMLLFDEESTAVGPGLVCLRTTDGGPVVRLGEGYPLGFSPDGKWALALAGPMSQLVIYPTGPGETRRLPRGNLETYQVYAGGWFPEGKSVLFGANEAGKASRCYAQDVSGGPPRPVTPEATAGCRVSPDGEQILYSKPGGTWFIQRSGGGTAQAVPGLTADDRVIRWSADGRSVYVLDRDATLPFRFERLDLVSGRRDLIREVAPADRVGVMRCFGAAVTDDTRSYAYGYIRLTSQLFVVQGAR